MEALSIHRSFMERQVNMDSDDVRMNSELKRIKDLQEEMIRISNNPRDRLVVVLKSRVVTQGSVGKVVYADHNRNHCRVEFGNGERVSCALSSVDVIDWAPLPTLIPMVGERVINTQNGEVVVVAEWRAYEVRVQPPGLPEDTYTIDRTYVRRQDKFIQM
jgi:transcription antitermination factor NusA-like protein